MKKIIFNICITFIVFISIPSTIFGANYKVCVYDKKSDSVIQGVLHVVGSELKFDMYRSPNEGWLPFIFDNEFQKTIPVEADPDILLNGCPAFVCERSNSAYIPSVECSSGSNVYHTPTELEESDVKGLDEALIYQYGPADPSKVNYPSILSGGCPSDVGVFKLFQTAYDLIKIAVPVMLVLFATIDLGKAVAASDEGMIKKAQKHCFKRVAAAVVVYLSFALLELFVKIVSNGSDILSCVNEFLK